MLDILGLAAFDYDLNVTQNPEGKEAKNVEYIIGSQKRSLLSSLPFYRYIPTAVNRMFYQSMALVHQLADLIIQERRKQPSNGKYV